MSAPEVACLYMDADLLVLVKPSGLLCVPGRGPDKQDCLSRRALDHWPDALVVHRLDQATSGLVIMARNLQSQRRLSQAFAERHVRKHYQALVAQSPPLAADPAPDPQAWQTIDLPIAADWQRRPLRIIDTEHGKPSITQWKILPESGPHCRLLLQPVTGRTHQLRVHLAALGQPILGDTLYADAATQALSPRLQLHACHLRLAHPSTGEMQEFSSPTPF